MTTVGARVKDARERRGWTRTRLGKIVGVSGSAIGQIEAGQTKMPNPHNLFRIAHALGVDPEWLITGQGDVAFPTMMVPVVSWESAMEKSELRKVVGWIPRPMQIEDRADLVALAVRGNSMANPSNPDRHFPEGSHIFVELAVGGAVAPGDLIIARLESGTLAFKQYAVEDGKPYLMPLNPAFPPIFEPFTVVGRVLGVYDFRLC